MRQPGRQAGGAVDRGVILVGTIATVPCVLCAALARRWLDPNDRLRGARMYRCAACGGRFTVTGDALGPIEQGQWDAAELLAAVRLHIAAGALPRIENVEGKPCVIAVGRQTS